jgi:hypothetical protein
VILHGDKTAPAVYFSEIECLGELPRSNQMYSTYAPLFFPQPSVLYHL